MSETHFFLVVLVTLCIGGIVVSARYREGALAYPVAFCATMLFWFCPQILALQDAALPAGALTKTTVMACLCTIMACAGYSAGFKVIPKSPPSLDVDRSVLFGWMVTALGMLGLGILICLPPHIRDMRQPEGMLVVVDFLVRDLPIGLAIALLVFVRRRTTWGNALLMVTAAFLLYRIVVVSKRSAVLEVMLAAAAAAWFYRRIRIPAWTTMVAAPLMLAVIVIGNQYRFAIHQSKGQWSHHSLSLSEHVDAFQQVLSKFDLSFESIEPTIYEGRNAAINIAAKDITGDFEYGSAELGKVISIVLPRQIFGNLRENFVVNDKNDAYQVFGYRPKLGTPATGISTAYEGFWYFGCLWFFGFGFLMRRIFLWADAGSVLAQAVYPTMLIQSMLCVTHSTDRLPIALVQIAILTVPAYLVVTNRIHLFGFQNSAGHDVEARRMVPSS